MAELGGRGLRKDNRYPGILVKLATEDTTAVVLPNKLSGLHLYGDPAGRGSSQPHYV